MNWLRRMLGKERRHPTNHLSTADLSQIFEATLQDLLHKKSSLWTPSKRKTSRGSTFECQVAEGSLLCTFDMHEGGDNWGLRVFGRYVHHDLERAYKFIMKPEVEIDAPFCVKSATRFFQTQDELARAICSILDEFKEWASEISPKRRINEILQLGMGEQPQKQTWYLVALVETGGIEELHNFEQQFVTEKQVPFSQLLNVDSIRRAIELCERKT